MTRFSMRMIRHLQMTEGDGPMRAKYEHMWTLNRAIETNEVSICHRAHLYTIEQLSIQAVEGGYGNCLSYLWLRENGGLEGLVEMQSILQENENGVRPRIDLLTAQYLATLTGDGEVVER